MFVTIKVWRVWGFDQISAHDQSYIYESYNEIQIKEIQTYDQRYESVSRHPHYVSDDFR